MGGRKGHDGFTVWSEEGKRVEATGGMKLA